MAAPTDERDLAEDATRARRRAIATQLEIAAALDAGRGAGRALDDRRRRDVDRQVGRAARQVARHLRGAADLLAQLALLLASLAARTGRGHVDRIARPPARVDSMTRSKR